MKTMTNRGKMSRVPKSRAISGISPAAPLRAHLELDRQTSVLDVAVLDVLSQAEFLLNRAREIQRQILNVREIAPRGQGRKRHEAALRVQRVAREMAAESRQLPKILKHLQRCANTLKRAAAQSQRGVAGLGRAERTTA